MNESLGGPMIEKVVERLRALADESRIRLLLRLKSGECNVTSLAAELGLAQASASKHLNVLRHAGLVAVRREGTQALYSVKDQSIFEMCELVCGGVARHVEEEHAALSGIAGARERRKAARAGA